MQSQFTACGSEPSAGVTNHVGLPSQPIAPRAPRTSRTPPQAGPKRSSGSDRWRERPRAPCRPPKRSCCAGRSARRRKRRLERRHQRPAVDLRCRGGGDDRETKHRRGLRKRDDVVQENLPIDRTNSNARPACWSTRSRAQSFGSSRCRGLGAIDLSPTRCSGTRAGQR